MELDELDLLLEQLAVNSTWPETEPLNPSGGHASGLGESANAEPSTTHADDRKPCPSNVYSDLPPPVVATQSPVSVCEDLDSIMQDLLSFSQRIPSSPPSVPPPLTQKKSLKGKTLSGPQENKEGALASNRKPAASNQKLDAIDDLLGGLTSDLEKIGVRTVAKGNCASCGKSVLGQIVKALGAVWHPEHFVCASCNKELGTLVFFERDGQPYCEKDYHRLFSPRCGYCKAPITENILTALDQSWHPDHFFCTHCGDVFGTEGFLVKDGKPYCNRDFYLLFAPKCSGCSKPVKEHYLTAANGTWHPECFVCADCLQPFTGNDFMELDGCLLCLLHYHTRQGMLCVSCSKPISGPCISTMGGKFHPDHFVCTFCLRVLSHGKYKEHQGKAYCSPCYGKLID